LLDRNIDVVLSDVGEVVWYVGAILTSTERPRQRITKLNADTPPLIRNVHRVDQRRTFDCVRFGIYGPRFDDMKGAEPVPAAAPRQAHVSTDSDALVESTRT